MKRLVAKVGGSLFDLPDLRQRLNRWLVAQADTPVLLIPGGGELADAVRNLHRTHGLGVRPLRYSSTKSSMTARPKASLSSRT